MASSIAVTQISPYRAYFYVSMDVGAPITFQQSGAVAPNKDLSALQSGPLREYLARLANWAPLVAYVPGSRVLWRRVTSTDICVVPVSGVTTVDANIIQSGFTGISFNPVAGAGNMLLELVFLHSMSR